MGLKRPKLSFVVSIYLFPIENEQNAAYQESFDALTERGTSSRRRAHIWEAEEKTTKALANQASRSPTNFRLTCTVFFCFFFTTVEINRRVFFFSCTVYNLLVTVGSLNRSKKLSLFLYCSIFFS